MCCSNCKTEMADDTEYSANCGAKTGSSENCRSDAYKDIKPAELQNGPECGSDAGNREEKESHRGKPLNWIIGMIVFIGLALIILFCVFIKDADNCSERLNWPKTGLGTTVPEPIERYGTVSADRKDRFHATVKNSSRSGFEDYLADCQEVGYWREATSDSNSYSAYNRDGNKLTLLFNDIDDSLGIVIEAPKEFTSLVWPVKGLGSRLPAPESEIGTVASDTADTFFAYIGDTSRDGFCLYVSRCKEAGFNIRTSEGEDYYYAEDIYGNKVILHYKGNGMMSVRIDQNKEEEKADLTRHNESGYSDHLSSIQSFYGLDFITPEYLDVKKEDNDSIHLYPSVTEYYCSLRVWRTDGSSSSNIREGLLNAIQEAASKTYMLHNASEPELITVAGKQAYKQKFDGGRGMYAAIYNDTTGDIVIAVIHYDAYDASNYDYVGDFEKMLDSASETKKDLPSVTVENMKYYVPSGYEVTVDVTNDSADFSVENDDKKHFIYCLYANEEAGGEDLADMIRLSLVLDEIYSYMLETIFGNLSGLSKYFENKEWTISDVTIAGFSGAKSATVTVRIGPEVLHCTSFIFLAGNTAHLILEVEHSDRKTEGPSTELINMLDSAVFVKGHKGIEMSESLHRTEWQGK